MKVHRLDRARGVHPRMLELPRQLLKRCPFETVIAMHGGLRVDEALQKSLSGGGMSAATNLRITPHGRAGALDIWPLTFLAYVPTSWGGTAKRWATWEEVPQSVKNDFQHVGLISEGLGFRWGGRWVGKAYPNGDQPHHELPDWQRLPFPAPTYEFPADLEQLIVAA